MPSELADNISISHLFKGKAKTWMLFKKHTALGFNFGITETPKQNHLPSNSIGEGVWISSLWLLTIVPQTHSTCFFVLSRLALPPMCHYSNSICMKVNKSAPEDRSMRINFYQVCLLCLFGRPCSKETFQNHTACITFNNEGITVEREGYVAVYSLCVCAHTYECMHSLNNKSKTKCRILKSSTLKDNKGKNIKWSWFKRLWPSLCSCTALLEITFIAKKQAWLQGCLITHNDANLSNLFQHLIPHSMMPISMYRKDLSKLRYLIKNLSFERKSVVKGSG